jgi:isopentenyl-diphosphate delta-isomerase
MENSIEYVVLVNEQNEQTGVAEKIEAHKNALLHRAFSVFIFNDKNELLLQKRADLKYHSGGLWTNTCCGHPRPNEDTTKAAQRRLAEEMGISTDLTTINSFIYHAKLNNDLIEHELDFILFGKINQIPLINLEEVQDWRYISFTNLLAQLKANPENYTAWFKIYCERYLKNIEQMFNT